MIIYWAMLLWVPLIYGVYSINHKEDSIQNRQSDSLSASDYRVPLIYAVIVFSFFIFWIGMRKHIGDTTQYIFSFEKIPTNFDEAWKSINWEGKGPGFEVYNVLFKCFISSDYSLWLMSIALFCGFAIMKVLRECSCDFFLSSYIFISFGMFSWMMNGMRQFIAVSLVFLGYRFMIKGQFIRLIILVLFASTFHPSALLIIPIYFATKGKPWNAWSLFYIIIVIGLCMFAGDFFSWTDSVIQDTAYGGFTNQFKEDNGVNPIRFLFYLMFPIIALIKRRRLEPHYQDNALFALSVNMSLVTASLYLLGVFTSGILIGRLPIYTSVYNMILIPYLLKYAFDEKERKVVKVIFIILSLLLFVMTTDGYYNSERLNMEVYDYKIVKY